MCISMMPIVYSCHFTLPPLQPVTHTSEMSAQVTGLFCSQEMEWNIRRISLHIQKKRFLSLTHLSQIYSCFLHLCDRNPNLGHKVSPITLHLLLQPPSEGPASSPHFVSTLCPTVQGVPLKFWVLLKFSLLAQVSTDMSPFVDCPLASPFPL